MHPLVFSDKLSKKWILWLVVAGLSVSMLLGMAGQVIETRLLTQWNYFFLDSFLKYGANGRKAQAAVVIDVDDYSLSAVGQWPWPRYKVASLIRAVADAGPSAIGLDIIFSEPDRTSLNNIQKSFRQDFGLEISFAGIPGGLSDNDGYLGQVLSEMNVVGARYFHFDHVNLEKTPAKPEFSIIGKTDLLTLHEAPGVLNNIDAIFSRLQFNGFLNNQPDSDGMLRRVPLLIRHEGRIYPHLSLATFMRSLGLDTATVEESWAGPVIRVGRQAIPIDKQGYALVRFNGEPHLYAAISALDILNGSFDAQQIRDRIVFVGSSAAALHDQHSTIFDSQTPGLKMQSMIVENMATDHFVREPSWAGKVILAGCITAGLLVSILFIQVRNPWLLSLGSALLAAMILLISWILFQLYGMYISPAMPLLDILILFAFFFHPVVRHREKTRLQVVQDTGQFTAGHHRVHGRRGRNTRSRDRCPYQAHAALCEVDRRGVESGRAIR